MAICLIGNGVYHVDECTAWILSDGKIGYQKFSFPNTDFRIYLLKKESDCGFIDSGIAIIYFKDVTFREWVEVGRADTPSGQGYVEVWFDIKNPGDKYWKIVWGDCTKEFISGDPIPILPPTVGDWNVELLSGKGNVSLIDNGVTLSTIAVYDPYIKKLVSNINIYKYIEVTNPILTFEYRFESTGEIGATWFNIQIIRKWPDYSQTVVNDLVKYPAGTITAGKKEYDLSKHIGASVLFYIQIFGDYPEGSALTNYLMLYNIRFCLPNWQCEQPLNGYEVDVSDCISGANIPKRRQNPLCEPCIPIWRCRTPYDGIEIDGCGNSRYSEQCMPGKIGNGIINGSFDNNLNGWDKIVDCTRYSIYFGDVCIKWPSWTNAEVIWDNGRARLRVLRCADAYLEQTFKITGSPISFDWQTSSDGWGETQGYEFLVDDSIVKSENLPNYQSGIKFLDTSQYIGEQGTLRFYVMFGTLCYMNDHGNTYIWVDNIKMPCTKNWQCEQPLNRYEYDGCSERRLNPECNPCIPNWQCEQPLNGFESDGCGNRRENPACTYREAVLISCQWPLNITTGKEYPLIIIVNQGNITENYKLVFSGDIVGETNPFLINAGNERQQLSIPIKFEATMGQKSVSATLTKA